MQCPLHRGMQWALHNPVNGLVHKARSKHHDGERANQHHKGSARIPTAFPGVVFVVICHDGILIKLHFLA